jgi:glycosyltransferase involved in cell wall biosynthesis
LTDADHDPVVSIVIPMRNEIGYIDACLDGFASQDYPSALLDVVVVDGGSTDGSTERVTERSIDEPWIRIVDNPRVKASAAFNIGVGEAKGGVVCLFSAHGVPDPSYVRRSVDVLTETGADGVGGRYHHVGLDPTSNAIGLAMVSPFGMASPHRHARARQEVDTISHPAYRADALAEVGAFDETLERNSDYELNYRLRQIDKVLLFDPSVESIYRPRSSLRALGRQFWWYGRWKARVARRHPGSLRPRHLVAPAAVAGGLLVPFLLPSCRGRRLVAAGAAAYGAVVVVAVARARPIENEASPVALAACFPIMHASWGAGFLASMVEDTVTGRAS